MPFRRRTRRTDWGPEHHELVRRELARLDPWSYRVAALDPSSGAEYAVVGTTGAFVIAILGIEGYVEASGARITIDGRPVGGFRAVVKAAKAAEGTLLEKHVFTDVHPLICLTKAMAGLSRTVKGVRVVRLDDLASEIAGRPRSLEPDTARKGAEALGRVLPTTSRADPEPGA